MLTPTNLDYWESLDEFVSVDTSLESNVTYGKLYCCDKPVALIGVGPGCITPVFEACINGTCSCIYVLCGVQCQLKPCRFASAVLGFNCDVSNDDLYVLTSAYRGVRIVDHNCSSAYICENYSSITGDYANEMTVMVKDETDLGKVRLVDTPPRCVHALGGVAKSNGKLRPITDCSMPEINCINLSMNTTCEKFHYKSVDHVVDIMDRGDLGAVSDISSAYRTIHIIPSHRTFQGFAWDVGEGVSYYEDLRLCFGLKCAPFAFTKFSDFLVKCCLKQGAERIVNYLDDFAILGDTMESCSNSQEILHRVLCNFGFEVALSKCTSPSTVFKYLGIIVDTVEFTLSIGEDKLARVKNSVSTLLGMSRCKRDHLEEVAGLLAHCATVVKGGKTFARRIYNVLRDTQGPVIDLDCGIQQDLIWWASFAQWFNGKARVLGRKLDWEVAYTDSSNYGFGAHMKHDYCWGAWTKERNTCIHSEKPPAQRYDEHINIRELWAVVVAVHRWGAFWKGKNVMIMTDNTQVQGAVNLGRSINPYAMAWLRELFWVTSFYNINLKTARISSEDNVWADSLSRLNNIDSITICEHAFSDFSTCCRAACPAG